MTDANTQPDWRRPLETKLDLSPQPVPLFWAEGGLVVRVDGTRISLEHVITYYRMGYTPQMIAQSCPTVALADIYSVIAYYLKHKKAVHAHLRETSARADEGWAEMAARGAVPEESYQAYCESRADDWFNDDC